MDKEIIAFIVIFVSADMLFNDRIYTKLYFHCFLMKQSFYLQCAGGAFVSC